MPRFPIHLHRIRWHFTGFVIDVVALLPVFNQIYNHGYDDGYDDGADDTPPRDDTPLSWLDRFKALKYHFRYIFRFPA